MIKIIAAMSKNKIIGNKGTLPWHLPPDLNFFKEMTKNQIIVMGRKTWESLPKKPLPSRFNVIVSRHMNIPTKGNLYVCRDLIHCIGALQNITLETEQDIFLIGGGSLFRQALNADIVQEIFLTEIDLECEGDTEFPLLDETWKPIKILEGEHKGLGFVINRWTK